jgi:hypothetical protein
MSDCVVIWGPGWEEKMREIPKDQEPIHEHTWTSTDGRARCSGCGRHRPKGKFAFNVRCEWCKELFVWKPKSAEMVERMTVRRTCGKRCAAALQVYENNKHQEVPA